MRIYQFIPQFTEEVERDGGAQVRAVIMSEKTCKQQGSEGSVKYPRKFSTFFTEDPNLKAKNGDWMYLEITEEQRDVGTTELIEISRRTEPRPFLQWRPARRETARERVETDVFLSQEDKETKA
ncbi:hypothetical protein F2Q69_00054366 [Brassica cretica]|uniref:Uncharacterized protein n=1 Tax=Brassica cretica TaxID=69181 RepID=A0A8S9N147_BRACR|nr:hypothetical protein F2Q69_00054366 [Brassica cretica]